jgi:hypothetical protein
VTQFLLRRSKIQSWIAPREWRHPTAARTLPPAGCDAHRYSAGMNTLLLARFRERLASPALPFIAFRGAAAVAGAKRLAALRPALLFIALLGVAGPAGAKPWWMQGAASNEQDFLPPDIAFRVAAHVDGDLVRIRWVIADGYYLYRRKIEVKAESPDLVVYPPVLPRGSTLSDVYFGPQEVYFQQVEATVAFSRIDGGAHPLQIKVTYQGCAQAGLCYPPITRVIFPSAAPIAADAPVAAPHAAAHAWELVAIGGGGLAFLLAGLMLRRGRQLEMPSL